MNKFTKLTMALCMATSVGALAEVVEVDAKTRPLKYMDGSTGKETSIDFTAKGGPERDDLVEAAAADCLTQESSMVANLIRKDAATRVDIQVLRRLENFRGIELHHAQSWEEAVFGGGEMLITYQMGKDGCVMMDEATLKQGLHQRATAALDREQKKRKLGKTLDAICEGDACEAPEAQVRH